MGAKTQRRLTGEEMHERCLAARDPCQKRFGEECPAHTSRSNHCGHGAPSKCCACGAFEEPLLEAMRTATEEA